MSRSLTVELIRIRFPDFLRGQEWRGAREKYWFFCERHGNYRQMYNIHQQNHGCPKCAHCVLPMKELENKYPDLVKGQKALGSKAKYWFTCETHGEYKQRYNGRQKGHGCPQCGREKAHKTFRTIDSMQAQCPDLLPGQRAVGVNARYWFKCDLHGRYKQIFNIHRRGSRCPKCGDAAQGAALSLSIEDMEKRCPDLIPGQKASGVQTKYWFRCNSHGNYRQRFSAHQQGRGCIECAKRKPLAARLTLGINFSDLVLGQRIVGANAKYWFQCSVHGEYQQWYGGHKRGGCPQCSRAKHASAEGRSKDPEYVTAVSHHTRIYNKSKSSYTNMPFCNDWNPDKGGSFLAAYKWIISNIGPRPKGCSLHVIEHSKGFVPGNLEWSFPQKQNAEQMYKIITRQKHQLNQRQSNTLWTEVRKALTLLDRTEPLAA